MLTQFRRLMVNVLALLLVAPFSIAQSARHPVDDLTTDEYWVVYDVITASGHLDPDTRFISILLHEPDKSAVLAWKPGALFTREADVVLQRKEKVIEACVDISSRKLESWKEIPGVQSAFPLDEILSLRMLEFTPGSSSSAGVAWFPHRSKLWRYDFSRACCE